MTATLAAMGEQDVDIAQLRRAYTDDGLDPETFAEDPVTQFCRWLTDAVGAGLDEPNAMTLATADAAGRPSARTVLLKDVTEAGFAFYTNHASRKGRDLAENPNAALVFHWRPLGRQVTVTGRVARVPDAEADAYFASRPRDHQLGAWASRQSEVLTDRTVLDQRLEEADARFSGGPVPRPEHWGGYRIDPDAVEFWQGRPSRLHDRLRYSRAGSRWVLERLSP